VSDWAQIHETRGSATTGLAYGLSIALHTIGIEWNTPSTLKYQDHQLCFGLRVTSDGRQQMGLACYNETMHKLRVFLRRAVVGQEANRLPFSYSDLSGGWSEVDIIRRATHSLRFVAGGPSLLTASVWTRWNSWKSGYDTHSLCVRCSTAADSLGHRLWRCPGNATFRDWLENQLDGYQLEVDSLPKCLSRCGIAPSTCEIPPHVIVAIQQYMVMVNNFASQCYSDFKKGLALANPCVNMEPFQTAQQRLKSLAIKPITKKQGLARPAPSLDTAAVADAFVDIEVHFDGSYTPDTDNSMAKAGFGIVVAIPGNSEPDKYHCPVMTVPRSPYYRGATRLSNNVAEVHGAIFALEIASTTPPGKVIIGYDSEYARRTITGEWRCRHNARVVAFGRLAYRQLCSTHMVVWSHIDSHTGHHLNELADQLAELGADGTTHMPTFYTPRCN